MNINFLKLVLVWSLADLIPYVSFLPSLCANQMCHCSPPPYFFICLHSRTPFCFQLLHLNLLSASTSIGCHRPLSKQSDRRCHRSTRRPPLDVVVGVPLHFPPKYRHRFHRTLDATPPNKDEDWKKMATKIDWLKVRHRSRTLFLFFPIMSCFFWIFFY